MMVILLKQIWNQRRANGWIFAELFLVFIILWYVIDFLVSSFICVNEPKGYDTDHVFYVSISVNQKLAGEPASEGWRDNFQYVLNLIKAYPGVESVCCYAGCMPYEESGSIVQGYTLDSLHTTIANYRMVNKEFFDVFKLDVSGMDLEDWNEYTYPIPAILSKDLSDSIFIKPPMPGQQFADYYVPQKKYKVTGIAPMGKLTEYDRYFPLIYVPMEEWMFTLPYWVPPVAVRVNPSVEEGFASRFMEDMRRRLDIGALYLSQIRSDDEVREIYNTQINNYIRSSYAIIFFFIFNVFLSIMGTFWFRTSRRRNEIALRMAMGASKQKVGKELVGEGLYILILAAIPAFIVCLNMYKMDLTVNTLSDSTPIRFLAGIIITFFLLAVMILLGIAYPSYEAMKIEPAKALNEE